jgi:protein TonB
MSGFLPSRGMLGPFSRLGALSPNDRLGVSLFGSLLIHMIVILGVSFAFPKWRELKGLPTLEITLVQTRSDRAPDKPEFLAQANQDGGGTSDKADIARNPLPVRELSDSRRFPLQQLAPQPKVDSRREATDLTFLRRSDWEAHPRETAPERKELRQEPWNFALYQNPELARERAQLNAEIDRAWQEYQKRPRRKYLNARAQEYKYAAYMEAWRAKVERIGNLNYPDEAKRRHLTGNLVLDVAINSDGSVNSIMVRRPSGHKLLDDAAVRIVELCGGFGPFTPEMKAETDVLHITRTWKFNETISAE